MKYIKLNYRDFELFDISITEIHINYYSNHKDAYRQMWKDQGKDFWLRYLLTYRSFSSHYGFIGRSASSVPYFSELVDWVFIRLHEGFVDGTFSNVRMMIEDVALFMQQRHLVGSLKYTSRAKDPFYMHLTRDAYRRLFGSPEDKECYSRVIVFPLFEHFVISTFTCLRRWMTAIEADPNDTSYWDPPPPAPQFEPAVEPPMKKGGKKSAGNKVTDRPRFRTTTVPPDSNFTMISIRPLYDAELVRGKPTGPAFVKGWPTDRDPRFVEPLNPLYDPSASRDTDWRGSCDVIKYLRFSDYVAHMSQMKYRYVLESHEDENIFSEEVMNKLRRVKVKPDSAAVGPASTSAAALPPSNSSSSASQQDAQTQTRVSSDKQSTADTAVSKKRNKKPTAADNTTKLTASNTSSQKTKAANKVSGAKVASTAPAKPDSGDNSSKDEASSANPVNVNSSDQSAVNQKSSSDVDVSVEKNGIEGSTTETSETSLAVSSEDGSSTDVLSNSESLRFCARCQKQESALHEFKKCKKCKELSVKEAKYYCSRECQLEDWTNRHRQEHRDWQRSLASLAPSGE